MNKRNETRMCIQVSRFETKCCGNGSALRALADELLRISASDPEENFEVHIRLSLSNDDALFGHSIRKNIWVVIANDQQDDQFAKEMPDDAVPAGYEVTFMHVTEGQLDRLEPT